MLLRAVIIETDEAGARLVGDIFEREVPSKRALTRHVKRELVRSKPPGTKVEIQLYDIMADQMIYCQDWIVFAAYRG